MNAIAYDVYLNNKLIDTVWFTGYDEIEAKRSLIDHDGYDSRIEVRTRIGKHATTIQTDRYGCTRIVYHDTTVVTFNDAIIELNTDGWFTPTTKEGD